MREFLRHSYKRRIDGRNRVWAARWWEHEEAIARLEALWRAWEASRLDEAGATIGSWREADHHMAVRMDTSGPFVSSSDTNPKNERLPYEVPRAACSPTSVAPADPHLAGAGGVVSPPPTAMRQIRVVATQARTILSDDLDGTEGARTYAFASGTQGYEIDLTDEHRDDLLRALEPVHHRRAQGTRPVEPRQAVAGSQGNVGAAQSPRFTS